MLYILCCSIAFIYYTARQAEAEKFFYIERPKLALELSYEFIEEIRTGQNINSEDVLKTFKEKVMIETQGWVYHPALLEYSLGIEPEWNQVKEGHDTRTSSEKKDRNSYLSTYYFDATLFQFKPYTLQVFSRRQNIPVTSAFAEKSDTLSDTYGANMYLKYKTLPTTFGYTHNESDQTGFYTSSENSDDFRLKMRLSREKHDTDLNISFFDKKQLTNYSDTYTETLNSDIQNQYDFARDKRRKLNSSVFYRQSKSELFDTSRLTWDEKLLWEHNKDLESYYQTNYIHNKYDDFQNETKALEAGLSYDYSENLNSRLFGGTTYNDYTDGKEKIYRGGLAFRYDSEMPLGIIGIHTKNNFKLRYREDVPGFMQVINESHILSNSNLTYLNNENIDVSTIIVTDATITTTYTEGIDYTATEQGTRVRIDRIPLGAIADGDNVLISYKYENLSAFDDLVTSQSYDFTYNPFKPLTLRYGYQRTKQTPMGGITPDTLDNSRTNIGEIIWDWQWSKTKLFYEDSDRSSGNSTTRWLVEETLTFMPSNNFFYMFYANYGETNFKEEGTTQTFYNVRSQIDYLPVRWMKISLEGFRNDISGGSVDTLDHGFSTKINFFFGIWKSNIEYVFINEEDKIHDESREYTYIIFEIIRTLW